MPVWHERTQDLVDEGRLALLGIVQEQHPDRARLFAQWHEIGWPILHDPIDVLGAEAVPIFVAIDEYGIVRAVNPSFDSFMADFVEAEFADDAPPLELDDALLEPAAAARMDSNDPDEWCELADADVLWGWNGDLATAFEGYTRAIALAPDRAELYFRLGVAHRLRHERADTRPDDFQRAVDLWGEALARNPNQYIWRRRIQQYGPRLDKPYPFYDWVDEARAVIEARGATPIALSIDPYGAEIAQPARRFESDAAGAAPDPPDPHGRVRRDEGDLIEVEVAVVPRVVAPGASARVHVTLRPRGGTHWNNEGDPLRLWVDAPEGWQVSAALLEAPPGNGPETDEVRRLDFELAVPADAREDTPVSGYALFAVCAERGGQCLFLRRDVAFEVPIGR